MASFGSAFKAARKAGKKEFSWNGKRYNTKLASDTPKATPTPSSGAVARMQNGTEKAAKSAASNSRGLAMQKAGAGGTGTPAPAKVATPAQAKAPAQAEKKTPVSGSGRISNSSGASGAGKRVAGSGGIVGKGGALSKRKVAIAKR